jgi:hypothetical protein
MADRIHQAAQQPTPSPEALAEAADLTRDAGLLYANAAHDAEQQGDEPRARELWQRADQNLTAVTA